MDLLSAKNPFERLDAENLPAFFVLVEEISHFHLLVSRIERDQPVRGIELSGRGRSINFYLQATSCLSKRLKPFFSFSQDTF